MAFMRENSIDKSRNTLGVSLSKGWSKYGLGILFILPFVVLFTTFYIVPVFTTLGLSLTNYNMIQKPLFMGFNNYKLLFTDDTVFLTAIKNTFVFAAIVGPGGYIMSFIMAWIINQLKVRNAFSLAFYAPSITSGIAMSYVWLYIFSSDRYGVINNILFNMGLIDTPILWSGDPKYIMIVVIIVSLWMSMGTGFLVFLAGFQNIDPLLYEAASIDGASGRLSQLWYITLPQMKPQMLYGAVFAIVNSFSVFEIAMTVAGLPSPEYAAHTIVAHLFDYAFIRFQMGYASAIAVFLFILTFGMGRLAMRVFREKN
jgi:multiple sugar transport system permease protein